MLYSEKVIKILDESGRTTDSMPDSPEKDAVVDFHASQVVSVVGLESERTSEIKAILRQILKETEMSRAKGSHEFMQKAGWFQREGRQKLSRILKMLEDGLPENSVGRGGFSHHRGNDGSGHQAMA